MSDIQRAIMMSLIINIDTLSNSRNEEEKILAIDITENEDYNSSIVRLSQNNEQGTNPKSSKTLYNIESFFYLYLPYKATLVITNMDNTVSSMDLVNVVLLNSAFKSIEIINKDTAQPLIANTIYS